MLCLSDVYIPVYHSLVLIEAESETVDLLVLGFPIYPGLCLLYNRGLKILSN